jgi:MarR family transcriptional regulator, negative regulator of the multidrug operon emrRAB
MQTRAGNLLGASPNGVADRVQRQTEAVAGRSDGRVAALATLAQWLGDTTEELRHCLGLSHPATVRVIDGLVTDGLAEQEHPGDGPAVRPRPTRAGQVQARRILAARMRVLHWPLSDLSGEELKQSTATVERLLERLTPDFNAGEVVCRLCDSEACPQDRCPFDCMQRQLMTESSPDSTASATLSRARDTGFDECRSLSASAMREADLARHEQRGREFHRRKRS